MQVERYVNASSAQTGRKPHHGTDRIKEIWAEMAEEGSPVNATKVHEKAAREGIGISLRKVQYIVKELNDQGIKRFKSEDWMPWEGGSGSPESVTKLLLLNAVAKELTGSPLKRHEAEWGERILPAISDLDPVLQWAFVFQYGLRERVAHNIGSGMAYTDALDALLAFSPWRPDSQRVWALKFRDNSSGLLLMAMARMAISPAEPVLPEGFWPWAVSHWNNPAKKVPRSYGDFRWVKCIESLYERRVSTDENPKRLPEAPVSEPNVGLELYLAGVTTVITQNLLDAIVRGEI